MGGDSARTGPAAGKLDASAAEFGSLYEKSFSQGFKDAGSA